MSAYVDLALLKAWIGVTDEGDDSLLQYAIDAACASADRYTGRSFAAEAGAVKYFYPDSATRLTLQPDATAITEVLVDSAGDLTFALALDATDYLTMPLQSFPDAGIIGSLTIAPTSAQAFYCGSQVKVTGDWGYTVGGAAPLAVQEACLLLAARYFKRRESPMGILQTVDLGQFTRISKADPDVLALLDPYRAVSRMGCMY